MISRVTKRAATQKNIPLGNYALVMSFAALVSFLPYSAKAQYPWTGMPARIENKLYPGDSIPHTVSLKLDTLYTLTIEENNPDKALRSLVNTWYSGQDKYGYGYIDEAGRPYGKWYYYIQTAKGYEKFCEGSYVILTPANLVMEKRFEDLFTTTEKQEQKKRYLEFCVANWLFTGEWNFYNQSGLVKRLTLGNNHYMEFNEEMNDKGDVIAITVSADQFSGKLRQAGNIR
jgi:hypothetical protein